MQLFGYKTIYKVYNAAVKHTKTNSYTFVETHMTLERNPTVLENLFNSECLKRDKDGVNATTYPLWMGVERNSANSVKDINSSDGAAR